MIKKISSSFKLTTLIIIFPLVTLLLYGVLSHWFFFYSQKQDIQNESKKYEKMLFSIEKSKLKEKVENLIQFVHYYDSKSSERIKKDAKKIVDIAADITNNLYNKYKDKLTEQELKQMIINTLNGIKFEGNLGYLFLIDLKGNIFVHIDPKMVGTNILDIQDVYGKYIVREFNKVLLDKGFGYVDYYWYINGKDRKEMYYKISYVKLLDCYDWYVGAGEYLKYMKKDVKIDILKYIRANQLFKNGTFFITNSNNKIILKLKSLKIEKNPLSFVQEGYYHDNKYISYSDYFPQYDWYITAIKDITTIKKDIEKKRKKSELKREKNAQTNFYLLLLSWIISLLLSIYLSIILNKKLKEYEEELKETNNKLIFQSRQAITGELLPMIAHQWRQPINKMASILALLRFSVFEKNSSDELDKKYKELEDNIEFMSETIDDFRTFYNPSPQTSHENLKTLIEKSINFIESSIRKKEIKVELHLEDIYFNLYKNEFLQVMINLIKNAVDSMEKDGELKISLCKEGKKILIIVEDNGKGIPKKDMDKIFEPYFSTKKDSMGLGLYMSKIIIHQHIKGEIRVKRLKKGTRFIIVL